jgi:hypothetical protein
VWSEDLQNEHTCKYKEHRNGPQWREREIRNERATESNKETEEVRVDSHLPALVPDPLVCHTKEEDDDECHRS